MSDAPNPTPSTTLNAEDIAHAVELLERIAADRSLLTLLSREERNRLLKAAGRVAFPDRESKMQLRQAFKKRARAKLEERKAADETTLAKTGIRTAPNGARQLKKASAPAPFELDPLPTSHKNTDETGPRLQVARSCYICKQDYDRVHSFYDSLCPECAEFNWAKREQTADLTGRYALVTGGRVKIGFHAVLKLLRAGANVVVTTRFPSDAARRFVEEDDSADWHDRLQIHGIDLRHAPSVEALCDHLVATLPRLDFLLNNACQTVRRPPGF